MLTENPIESKDVTRGQAEAAGLSLAGARDLPNEQVSIGVGGHLMFMPGSGTITVDGVQLDGTGSDRSEGTLPNPLAPRRRPGRRCP